LIQIKIGETPLRHDPFINTHYSTEIQE